MGNRTELSAARLSPRPSNEPPQVVLASSSPKRRAWMEHVLGTQVRTVDGGDEADIENTLLITRGKLTVAKSQLLEKASHRRIVIAAADVRNRVLVPGTEPTAPTLLISRRKPDHRDEVRQTFFHMSTAGKLSGSLPFFMIDAAGGVDTNQGKKPTRLALATSFVELDPDVVDKLATEEGYEQYTKEVPLFYATRAFTEGIGNNDPVTVMDICSGLSVTVLTKMGAVARINGAEAGSPNFKPELRRAVHAAYVGLRPSLFSDIQGLDVTSIRERHTTFPLVDNIVDLAHAA